MDMNIDSNLVKSLRGKESWSQETLAERAELSLRTIQRVERDGIAAPQTRIALAKAFDISPAALQIIQIDDSVTGKGQSLAVSIFSTPARMRAYLLTYPLRFVALAILSSSIAIIVWIAFVILIEGIFFITHTDVEVDYWPNLGNAIIGASFFILPLLLLCWMVGKTRKLGSKSANISNS
jgi:DNA-binding XRE family transcriptional regulator